MAVNTLHFSHLFNVYMCVSDRVIANLLDCLYFTAH